MATENYSDGLHIRNTTIEEENTRVFRWLKASVKSRILARQKMQRNANDCALARHLDCW